MPIYKIRGRLSYDRVAQVRSMFRQYDKDQSNSMDAKELGMALRALNIMLNDQELQELCSRMDEDNTGKIELGEFIDWFPTFMSLNEQSKVRVNPGVTATGIDWVAIREKLPSEKTSEAKRKRMDLFKQFDPNGNGYLSLAETDKGFRDVVQLHSIFNCKPVIMRAFQAARSINDARNKPSSHGPNYIERCEFRMLLWYVREYFELWQMFAIIDSSDDRRIDMNEFASMYDRQLAAWGVKAKGTAAEEFQKIDKNGGGIILFDEFAEWALRLGLDLEDDDE